MKVIYELALNPILKGLGVGNLRLVKVQGLSKVQVYDLGGIGFPIQEMRLYYCLLLHYPSQGTFFKYICSSQSCCSYCCCSLQCYSSCCWCALCYYRCSSCWCSSCCLCVCVVISFYHVSFPFFMVGIIFPLALSCRLEFHL